MGYSQHTWKHRSKCNIFMKVKNCSYYSKWKTSRKERKEKRENKTWYATNKSQSVSKSVFLSIKTKQNKTKHSLIIKNVVWVFHIIFYRNLRKKNCSLVKLYITKARNRKVLWCAKNWYYNRNVCKIIDWIKQFILRGADCHTLLDLINFV